MTYINTVSQCCVSRCGLYWTCSDMDEVKVKKSIVPFLRQCFVTLSVTLNLAGHGAVIGFSAVLIPSLRRPESHIKTNTTQESSIASVIGMALIVGNVAMTVLMSYQGRKLCHFLTQVPILAGWFIIVLADSVAALIFARFLQGVSMGMMGPLGAVIIAETTHPENRGAFLSTISLSLTIGVFFCHMVGTYLSWQQSAFVMAFIPFSSIILTLFAPETPAWLISKGRYEEATQIFYWLRGQDEKEEAELESMITAQNAVKKSSIAGQKVSVVVKVRRGLRYMNVTYQKPEFYKPLTIMFFMFLLSSFAGINVLSSYTIDVIRQVVGPDANAKMLMVAMDVSRVIVNLLAVYLVRKLNRRTVLFISGWACVLSYFAKAGYVYAKANDLLPAVIGGQWLPITILGLYVTLTIGLTIVPFTISGEIYPLEYRALGGGISSVPWSINFFIAVKCFPILTVSIGLPLTYLLYNVIVIICLIFLYIMLPETKDRTLQDIEDGFRGLSSRERKVSEPLTSKEDTNLMRRNSSFISY